MLHACKTHEHNTYNVGFYEQQIDLVQLSVFEQFLAHTLFFGKRAKFVVATVKISISLKDSQCNSP